jgi:hypothetical protein
MPLSSHPSHYIVNLCKFLQIIFPCPNIRICPQLSLTVANQEWFIVALLFDLTGNAISSLIRKIRVHFMFRLTTPRKFFKVIYALDTRYSVMVKEKVLLTIKWSKHLICQKDFADIVFDYADIALALPYPLFLPTFYHNKMPLSRGFCKFPKIILFSSQTRQSPFC